MQTVGYAALQVIPSMKGAKGVIEGELNGSLGSAGQKGGTAYGSGLIASATKYAKRAVVVTAAVVAAGTVKGGIDRALNIDAARGKLKGLGHDAKSVNRIMGSALKSVQGTAYGLDAAATTAAGAVAAGVKPGKELTKYLSLSADAASIAGVSMSEMGSIFNKVQTAQRAYTTELNMLADRGIPIYQWLQKEYGVTATELRKMVAEGKVDATTYKKVIEDNIGGAAKSSGDTMRGTLANVGAAFSRLGASVISGTFPTIKKGLGSLITSLDGITPAVTNAAQGAGRAFTGTIIPAVKSAYTWFATYLWPAIRTGAATIAGAIGPAASAISSAFASMDGDGGSAAVTIGQTLAGAITAASQVIAGVITVTGQAVALFIEFRDVTFPLAAGVLAIVAAYKTYKMATAAATAVTKSYRATVLSVKAAQQAYAMGTYGMASGQKGLVAGLANMAGRLKSAGAAVGGFIATQARAIAVNARWQMMLAKQSMSNMIAGLKVAIVTAKTWIVTQVKAAAAAVASAARSTAAWAVNTATMLASKAAAVAFAAGQAVVRGAVLAGAAAQWALNAAMSANPIGLVVVAVAALAGGLILLWQKSETFRTVVTAGWNAIRTASVAVFGYVKNFITTAWNAIGGVVKRVLPVITGAVRLGFGVVSTVIRTHLSVARKIVEVAWSAVSAIVRGAVRTVVAVVRGVSAVAGIFRSAWNGAKSAVVSTAGGIITFVKGIPGKIKGVFSGSLTMLSEVGLNIVQGLGNGIVDSAGRIISWAMKHLTDLIPGKVKSFLGIASPSKVMRKLARWIPAGIAVGIRDGSTGVSKALKSVTDQVTKASKTALKSESDRIIAARRKQNNAIRKENAKRGKGTKAKSLLPAITRAEADTIAKRNIKTARAQAKKVNALVKAQSKTTKGTWAKGASAGTDAILASLNKSGSFKKNAAVQTATLADLAKARDVLATRLSAAKSKLADAIGLRDDFKASVIDAVKSYTSVLRAEGKVNPYGFLQKVTASDIASSMRERLAVVTKFTADMAALAAAGLNKDTYEQLMREGPEGAADYAAALAAGGTTAVSEVNGLQSQINSAANTLGTNSSRTLYQAGVDAAQGLVKGIESQIDKIEKASKKVAERLAKAIKKALGIRSPSRVMAAIARWVPAGLAIGMTVPSRLRQVATAAGSVASAAANGVRSRLSDVARASGAVQRALVVDLPSPNLPGVPPPRDPEDPGNAGGGYGGPRVVVQQTINNPVAEPSSKSTDSAARILGMVGAV